MGIFGRERDILFIHSINDELIRNVIEQELLFYKYNAEVSSKNLYGESLDKFYDAPVLLNHLMETGDQVNKNAKYGTENNRMVTFQFYRQHLIEANLYIEKGDLIDWHREFYEVDSIVENQYFGGKSEDTDIKDYMSDFGFSVSVIVTAKLVRLSKLNIIDARE